MSNPILDEVYKARDEIAKECHYDVDAIFDHAARTAKELGFKTVSPNTLVKRSKPKKILAKPHARPAKAKRRTKTTKH